MKNIITICLTLLLLQSCSMIIGSKMDTVQIDRSNENVDIYYDNNLIPKNTKTFEFEKSYIKQLSFKLDSHKTENTVFLSDGYTTLYYLGNIILPIIGHIFDTGSPNSYSYTKEIVNPPLRKYKYKSKSEKSIFIENVDISYFNKNKFDTNSINTITINNTVANFLTKTLYRDSVLNINFNKANRLYLSGDCKEFNNVINEKYKLATPIFYYTPKGKINWILTNIYNDTIYSKEISTTAGIFIPFDFQQKLIEMSKAYSYNNYLNMFSYKSMNNLMIEDFFETSLMDLFDDKDFQKIIQKEKYLQTNKSNITFSNDSKPKTVENVFETNLTIKKDDNEHGSGFLISKDGYFITNMTNVYKNKINKAIDYQNKEYTINVIATNPETNLALCKIDGQFNYTLSIPNEKNYKLGSKVFALGSPYSTELANTLTDGIISGVRSEENSKKLIQIDAKLNRGSMGGALIDKEFNLLGVVNYKLGGSTEGIGFAIDALDIKSELGIE